MFGKSVQSLNEKILSDCYESLIAAILLDSDLNNVKKFITRTLLSNISIYETETNHKGKLIEFQTKNKLEKPIFITKKNDFGFKTVLELNQKKYFGEGKNKKLSERNAAKKALSDVINP